MDTFTGIRDMQQWADAARRRAQRIGFVPTMGYLHAGHLSLVELARRHADLVVASIFVNPLQFAANEDLDRYPRDLERDTKLLTDAGTDVLFLPTAEAMYPHGAQTTVKVERVTQGLCGAARPTHFAGVTTVVAKLFHIVKPHVAVFGRKDFQQLVAIRRMVIDLDMDIEIIGGAIVREPDGLAMSSRNAYLSGAERTAALCLSRALAAATAEVEHGEVDRTRILGAAQRVIRNEPLARLEYAALTEPDTLEEVTSVCAPTLLALAVHVGKTRLIDNCILSRESTVESREPDAAGLQELSTLDSKL